MNYTYRLLSVSFCTLLIGTITHRAQATVADITGDTGGAQSGSVTLTGGSSGAAFDTTTATITQSFNYLALPTTTSTTGQLIIGSDVALHTFGTANQNIFGGGNSGNFSLSGFSNTAYGHFSLNALTDGNNNTASGQSALQSLTEGIENTAVGARAGMNLVSGSGNILIGLGAGSAYDNAESNNIIIGANPSVADEQLTIRIGDGQTQQNCFIDGIYGSGDLDSGSLLPAYIDNLGKLGTVTSSARFKDNVQNLLDQSKAIFKLRPVSFQLASDPKRTKQFGLIAEEVYKVFPELVVLDKEGKPYAVRYHELPVLVLNELQKKSALIEKLQSKVTSLTARIEKLEALLSC